MNPPFATERLGFGSFFASEPAGLISILNGSSDASKGLSLREPADSTISDLDRPVAESVNVCLRAAVARQTGSNLKATGNGRLMVGHTVDFKANNTAARTKVLGTK
ncbi:MAG: hypothetical protein NT013_02795 [Planctomycetia bacterium]|nr:hypothetical protein [Planctomycetia bacterium]